MSEESSVRSGSNAGNSPIMTDLLRPPVSSSVRWVVEDTSEIETANKPDPSSVTVTFIDGFWESNHRAHSMPNLADDNWIKLDDDGKMENSGEAETQTVALTTVTSVMTSAAISMTSSSQMKAASSVSSSKMKRAASFVEHPVITAVRTLLLYCNSYFIYHCFNIILTTAFSVASY